MAAHGSLTATLELRGRRFTVAVAEPGRDERRVEIADVTEIGRGKGPGLIGLAHPGVSRRHARLQVLGDRLLVTDLGSRNGTFVDGRRISAPTVLAPGAEVRVAGVRLTVSGAGAAPAVQSKEPGRPAEAFPNYLRLKRRIPASWWYAAQAVAVAAALALIAALLLRPALGLTLLWRVAVPVLPLLWLLAPGIWRNSCPLAATNQLPRLLGITRGLEPPRWLREHGFVVAVALFLLAVGLRRPLFDHSGPASAALLGAALLGALAGGLTFKGKSGWCSSICPLLPIQRLYGQTPFAVVPNSHCRPCVGCAKHCYDFNPTVAYQADLHDRDPRWTAPRRFFAGCMPGVVLGYFAVPPLYFPSRCSPAPAPSSRSRPSPGCGPAPLPPSTARSRSGSTTGTAHRSSPPPRTCRPSPGSCAWACRSRRPCGCGARAGSGCATSATPRRPRRSPPRCPWPPHRPAASR
ncbi:FHA domain-containing protein [Dactylosporangium darangshiense]|uniref:FHA domain-containing protein n=1 Tax=Dactylosporangium darangshiense TaxID=579108 RepID=UPI003628E576